MAQKNRLIIIAGPTAVGKTGLGVRVAKRLNGEIVSCDSMQIYRGMNVGTAKATVREMDGVPHHLLSFVDPNSAYSVAQYQQDALSVIEDIRSRGKVPILVGGTGLYIHAVLFPMTFRDYDPDVRDGLEREYDLLGKDAMYARLVALSPQMAAKLSPNDRKRVIRALELATIGAQHNTDDLTREARFSYSLYVLSIDRAVLYARIDKRVDEMLSSGLLDEVKGLLDSGVDPAGQSFQAIAYKELAAYFAGQMSLDAAVDLIKKRSRNYAKRQLTWFRTSPAAQWLDATVDQTDRIVADWIRGEESK